MDLLKDFEVTSRFTKVPNSLFHPDHELWKFPGAMRLYLQLLSRAPHPGLHSRKQLAAYLGMEIGTFSKNLALLKKKGFLLDEGLAITLLLPEAREEVAETKPEPTEAVNLIAEEVAEKAKRSSTGMSQADRWEAIKLAWNTYKPEPFLSLDGRLNLPLLIAIETQTKRLGVERDDYDSFIGAVLRGATADEWWSTKNMKASNLFGFTADIPDSKFESVEKLYKAGLKSGSTPKAELIDWTNDQQVLRAADLSVRNGVTHSRVSRIRLQDEAVAACLGQRIVRETLAKHGRIAQDEPRLRNLRETTANVAFDEDWTELGHLVLVYSETGETPLDWNVGRQFSDDPMIQRMPSNS